MTPHWLFLRVKVHKVDGSSGVIASGDAVFLEMAAWSGSPAVYFRCAGGSCDGGATCPATSETPSSSCAGEIFNIYGTPAGAGWRLLLSNYPCNGAILYHATQQDQPTVQQVQSAPWLTVLAAQ